LPLFGDGSALRDFTYVTDICAGFIAALTAEGVVGEAINLGHHEPIEIRTLIKMLAQIIGRTPYVEHRPANQADMAATNADLTKAARLLGYRPQVPFEQGLREFVAWFRAQR
jgi:UDP-glucuronate 4-epimerase